MTWYDHLIHFLVKPRFDFSFIGLWGAIIIWTWCKKLMDKGYYALMKRYIKGHRYIRIPYRACPYHTHRENMDDSMPDFCFKAELAKRVFKVSG